MKKSPKNRSAKNVNVPSRNTATSTIHVEPLNSSRVGQEHFDNSSRVWRKKMRMRSSHPFFFATKRISSRIAPMIDHSMIQSCKFPDGALAGSAVAGVSAVAVGAALLFVSFMFELFFSVLPVFGGGGGIRTPGSSRFNGFQDRRIRPLCHPSGMGLLNQLAGREGFEPPTDGFGDRCSTN